MNLNKKKGITECCAEHKFDKRYCHGQTCQCGLMPSPQPSPTGRGGKHKNGNVAVCCPHPSPFPQGEGANTKTATLRSDALIPALSHRERGQTQKRQRGGLMPSPQPSPTGREGKD
jgi:hypothetical protein